ncbi:MAG: P-loop NTPase [Elusimicrobiales bacterium]|nr:P-loop NTPase [Elusimicrobiales bacterium]
MSALDPRPSVIADRLKKVKKITAVTGWKGGIGKSVTAATLALLLTEKGHKTGLLDLDLTGASCHFILGSGKAFPREDMGLVPPFVHGVKFMSISFFSKGQGVPLRGANVTDAIIEMLAVTLWGELDHLVIDMPPGIGDAALDALKFFPKARILAVTTPSPVARDVLRRSLDVYKAMRVPVAGLVENMSPKGVPYDPRLDAALGDPEKLLKTAFARRLEKVTRRFAGG